MTHLTRNTGWGIIDVDLEEGRVFFQQRWFYHWTTQGSPTPPAWKLSEKRAFHRHVDRQIWDAWSNRIMLAVTGNAPFAKKFKATGLKINFDVRWVTKHGDFSVTATKVPAGTPVANDQANTRSVVDFGARTIHLFANDLVPRYAKQAGPNPADRTNFRTAPHEFGHTIQDDDEYTVGATWRSDVDSIMNIGRQLRERHLAPVISELNSMIPGCTISVKSLN